MAAKQTTLLIVGKAGNGKSSTGNSILPKSRFSIAHSFTSNDVECQATEKNNIRVVCAPDLQHKKFKNPKLNEEEEVRSWRAKTQVEPDAVILVIRCDKRFTPEESQAYEELKTLSENDWLTNAIQQNLVIVFTAGDRLNGRDLRQDLERDDYLKPVRAIWTEARQRYVVFDNTAKGPRRDIQVTALMDVVKRMAPHPFPQHVCRLLFVGPQETLETVWKNLRIKGTFGIFGLLNLNGLQMEMTFFYQVENEEEAPENVKVAVSPGPHAILDCTDGRFNIAALFRQENYTEQPPRPLAKPAGDFILRAGIDDFRNQEDLVALLAKEEFPARRPTMRGEFFHSAELGEIAEKICEKTMRKTERLRKAEESSYNTYLLVKKDGIANGLQFLTSNAA